MLARDLVNEPANVLGPVEFAARAEELKALGVEVEVLTEKRDAQARHGARCSASRRVRRGRRAWSSCAGTAASAKDQPVAFVGKGVVFDTGGISIKPAAGMEDMKGDMGGAAAVTGLMHALAARKAKVNAVGVIGLVENMPDGAAQRPGDIVTAHVGQDHRDHQHRRRGPPRPRRRARLHRGPLQAEVHDRSRDADRRDHRRARPPPRRHVRHRRSRLPARCSRPARRPASASGGCRSARTTTS